MESESESANTGTPSLIIDITDEQPKPVNIVEPELNCDTVKTESETDVTLVDNNSETKTISGTINVNCETTECSVENSEVSEESEENEKTEEKQTESNVLHFADDEGEDLPDSFFDDFSNNDFMAGLDIVDDWIDDENVDSSDKKSDGNDSNSAKEMNKKESHTSDKKDQTSIKPSSHSRRPYSRDRHRRSKSPRRTRRSRDRRDRDKRNRSKEPKNRSGTRKSPEKGSDVDSRRDPEKMKRDIQRDKLRCAKDQEARVFQEQLKVAETGLVPPGTELDVVLENQRKMETEKAPKRSKSPIRSKPRRNSSRERTSKRRTRSRSRLRYNSFRLRTRSRSRSRGRRHHLVVHRDEKHRDEKHQYHRTDENRRIRYFHEVPPAPEIRASRSPVLSNLSSISNVSEREEWLRFKDRSKPRYRRSCSPISSNSLSEHGSPKRKRSKKTFMEEIQQKLNEIPPYQQPQQTIPQLMSFSSNMVPFPQPNPPQMYGDQFYPVPGPHELLQPLMSVPLPQPMMQMPISMPMPMPPEMVPPPMIGMVPPPAMVPPPDIQMMHPVLPPMQQLMPEMQRIQETMQQTTDTIQNNEITKLFEEQKISLSDYLSVAAKPIDPKQPVNIHKKIAVITKCQEVIRALSNEQRLTGRFFPKLTLSSNEKRSDSVAKWKSPLKKDAPIRFTFTTPLKRSANDEGSMQIILNKALSICGLATKFHNPISQASIVPISRNSPVIPLKSVEAIIDHEKTPPPPPIPVLIKRSSVPVQTDPIKCQMCEFRNGRHFNDRGVQTSGPDTMDEATQVSVEDLNKSCVTFTPYGILKNASSVQSISHLTTAQLLALHDDVDKVPANWRRSRSPSNDLFANVNTQNQSNPFSNSGGNFNSNNAQFNNRQSADRFSGGNSSNDRFSPSPLFKDQGNNMNTGIWNSNMSNNNPVQGNASRNMQGNAGRNMPRNAGRNMPRNFQGNKNVGPQNRPFFGQRGGRNY